MKLKIQHSFNTDENYHLTDDPNETLSNLKYLSLNNGIKSRQDDHTKKMNQSPRWAFELDKRKDSKFRSNQIFHVSSAVFNPDGGKVISPNFVSNDWVYDGTRPELKKNAKTSLKHWTKEKVYK